MTETAVEAALLPGSVLSSVCGTALGVSLDLFVVDVDDDIDSVVVDDEEGVTLVVVVETPVVVVTVAGVVVGLMTVTFI